MKTEIPDFLLEMSQRMNTDDNRCTSHPFWQVRCKRYLVTEAGYSEHHWEMIDSESGTIYRSDTQELAELAEYLKYNHRDWWDRFIFNRDEEASDDDDEDLFVTVFDHEWHADELPSDLNILYCQEVEEIVCTALTQAGAEAFIKRKQHDYPPLYTYVESAYWSPELRQLQDWIKSLTGEQS
jgi:hypothetical protein